MNAPAATAALAELSDDEREVIVAHIWGGLTFAQIAEVTGLPSSTAHRRYEAGPVAWKVNAPVAASVTVNLAM